MNTKNGEGKGRFSRRLLSSLLIASKPKRVFFIILAFILVFSSSGTYSNSSSRILAQGIQSTPLADPLTAFLTNQSVYLPIVSGSPSVPSGPNQGDSWPTVAANPERSSSNTVEVSGQVYPVWYRPIEAYIPENVQVIASDGMLYISTARGLYALNAVNGDVVWRFDTELPLGNSPTVVNHVVYVGGFDHKLHALDGSTGTPLWAFDGASAGYSANPLVVNGLVITGNRDGWMYAIGAQGSPNAGKLVWKYQTGGPIDISAAYQDGVVYFAAMDNFAYALNASTGSLVWKSAQLPGDGFQSYWATIYQNEVVFSGSSPYRDNKDPGTKSIKDANGNPYPSYDGIQRDDIFYDRNQLGPTITDNGAWAHGNPVIDGSRATEYLENNPNPDPHLHKPWRRNLIVLNRSNGSEYTMDVDQDGYSSYAPFLWYGTHSGNAYPPIVGSDNVLYRSNPYLAGGIPQGVVMGWDFGTTHLSITGLQGADDEPQALSAGGNIIYRSICCDRVGDWFNLTTHARGAAWGYAPFDLGSQVPGYNMMWWGIDPNGYPGLVGNYGTNNGVYNSHGDQNPIIPYMGMLFIHRSNAIIAFGTGQKIGKLPLLTVNTVVDAPTVPTTNDLKARLESEVSKMITAGPLRPGYYNSGQWGFSDGGHLPDYFVNPGDTIYTLARAYPYLSPALQTQTKTYLQTEFTTYFNPTMYARIGWSDGAPREWMPIPPEVQASMNSSQKNIRVGDNWSWQYPPFNFYAMWKYAGIFPSDALTVYNLAKGELVVPCCQVSSDYFQQWPYELNAWISGYYGFLKLQEVAGMTAQDASLRQSVTNELNRLEQLRASTFTKDTFWVNPNNPNLPIDGGPYHYRALNVAQNFIFLTPELGSYLNQNALSKVQAAVNEYNWVAPYWFVSRYNAVVDEGVMQQLYDYNAIFQAKAYILKQSQQELAKYLDVAAFKQGDLLYMQDLIAAIEAPVAGQSQTTNGFAAACFP